MFNFSSNPITSPPFKAPTTTTGTSSFSSPVFTPPGASVQTPIPDAGPIFTPNSGNPIVSETPSSSEDHIRSSSVSLSCQSPDGKAIHSLLANGTIATRFYPLHTTGENEIEQEESTAYQYQEGKHSFKSEQSKVKTVTTKLPSYVLDNLKIEEPLELLCVDNDTPSKMRKRMHGGSMRDETSKVGTMTLPLLCIYTRSSVFVFLIDYEIPHNSNNVSSVTGNIVTIEEPFEQFLAINQRSVQRLRSAPHSHLYNGSTYQTMCNSGAMIMLTTEGDIVLFHGYKPIRYNEGSSALYSYSEDVTVPASINPEQTDMKKLVDFCFLPSSSSVYAEQSIWNSMTLVVCSEAGSLYALSPILFHNTVILESQISLAKSHLEKLVLKYDHSVHNGCESRRAKAALQYLKDAFGIDNNGNSLYLKANILHGANLHTSTNWPVTVQTISTVSSSENIQSVKCMEVIASSSVNTNERNPGICHIAQGTENSVDYILVSGGENILPRFAYEPEDDSKRLNELVCDSSMLIERVCLETGDENTNSSRELANVVNGCIRNIVLLPDPIDRATIHHVSKSGVVSITTNSVAVLEKKLIDTMNNKNDSPLDPIKTNAWSSISMAKNKEKELNGISISSDVKFGHVLNAVLIDGSTESLDLTAAMYLNEAKHHLESENSSSLSLSGEAQEANETLKAMESMKPLYELVKPYFEQVSSGVSNMTKIVGGSTNVRDISPGILATFLSMKQSSEQDIIIPIKELHSLIETRQRYNESMKQQQLEQIQQIKEKLQKLKAVSKSSSEKRRMLESNTQVLSERSAAVLSTAREMSPSLTQAEIAYFKEIDRYQTLYQKHESTLDEIKTRCEPLLASSSADFEEIKIDEGNIKIYEDLLADQQAILSSVKEIVHPMKSTTKKVMISNGIEESRPPLSSITGSNTN